MNRTALTLVAAALLSACADNSSDLGSTTGSPTLDVSRGVTTGGAQDIAQFRAVVTAGRVPAPSLLDATGFFAEHALDQPPATCGQTLCVNTLLAVAPRFDDSNWTMGYVTLSTAADPATRDRPALHMVVVIEDSPSVRDWVPNLRPALRRLAANLRATDRVTVVLAGRTARVPQRLVDGHDPAWVDALTFSADGAGLYDGLAAADDAIASAAGFSGASRVLLLTSGHADAGVTQPSRIVALGEALARRGVALSVVGLDGSYDPAVPTALGAIGAGTYAFATDGTDLSNILDAEGQTTLYPLATSMRLRVTAAPGYRIGRVYGARRLSLQGDAAVLDAPALFIGTRMGSRDIGGGRRGGGSGIFVELIPVASEASGIAAGAPAFHVEASWQTPDGRAEQFSGDQANPLAPGRNPDAMWPVFSDATRGKVFMMLNMYLALRASVTFFDVGDCARAKGVVDMMDTAVDGWLRRYPDPDLGADQQLLQRLRDNLDAQCRSAPPVQPRAWFEGGCFFL